MKKRKANAPIQLAIPEEDFITPLKAIHRNENAFIGFARQNGESRTGIENLFSLTRKEVQSMLPKIAEWLIDDTYMTVNGYNMSAPYNVPKTGLPGVWRQEKNLRCLNAVYADLDIGRAGQAEPHGLSVSAASQLLIDLAFGPDAIPPYSMTAQSGRGLYVFWLLRDEDDENAPITFQSQKTFAENLALYKAVNRAIYKRLDCLAADKICDAARLLRVPGTRHSKTGEKCIYRTSFDENGKFITYTLRELAERFGVPVMQSSLPAELRQWEPNPDPQNPKKANGPKALAAARARDLITIEQYRGGWQKGNRRFCLRLYAQFLRASGVQYADVASAVEVMAGNCTPPYPSDSKDQTLKALLRDVWLEPFAKRTQLNLVHWLRVSPDEARALELEKIIPIEVQDERRQPKGGARATAQAARQTAIETLIEEQGMLSEREFATQLQTQGIEAANATIHRDLITLGYQKSPTRKKAGRRSEQMTLLED